MKKTRTTLAPSAILPNKGQLGWLPKNPRQWTQKAIDDTSRSIEEDPDFLEDRPVLVTPKDDGQYVAFAGNLRYVSAKSMGLASVPVVIYLPETDEDRQTIKRRAAKDNVSFGAWDWDILANEWDDQPLADWGVPAWDTNGEDWRKNGLSSEGMEHGEGYDEFIDKFKQKLTTDDCFTPQPVYDAVLSFVGKMTDLTGREVVRPFFPGGNYEDMEQYKPGCIVVDNPPFSLLAKIIRFYVSNGIQFFLFGPALTLFSATDCDLTYIVSDSDIEYENGARVRTGFITNLHCEYRIWCCPELAGMIEEAQAHEDKTKQGFIYPDNIVTAAILMKLVRRDIELRIRKKSCEAIKGSDSAKEEGRDLYGGGFIMSDKMAAERAAAERAAAERAAAERAAATRINLSDREKQIIERLNKQDA